MSSRDDILLDQLRRIAARSDRPPEYVDAAARAALSTRRLGEELAELVADSESLVGASAVRDDGPPLRLLTFQTSVVSIEVQVERVAGRRSVRGQVSGASGEVTVETATRTHHVPIDERGWFMIDDLPDGVVRLRLHADDGSPVTTSWVS